MPTGIYVRTKEHNLAHNGWHHSNKNKRKQSELVKGNKNPMYDVHRFGEKSPMYGKHHNKETKRKISESNIGRILSLDTRQRMSKSRTGLHPSNKARQHMSKAQIKRYKNPFEIQKSRIIAFKRMERELKENNANWCNTDIEIIMKGALKKAKLRFKHQVYFKGIGWVDFCNKKKRIIIECDGDYPHCNPKICKANYYNTRIRMTAKEAWERDKNRTKRLEKLGYKVLRFWGSKIKSNLKGCICIISKYI